jgi:divalent metal cation (Fe/Co/Zn/Cd) transporter
LHVSLRCFADVDLPIVEAHSLADLVERRIIARLPGVAQVLVHIEPEM